MLHVYLYLNSAKADFLFNIHLVFLVSYLFVHSPLTCPPLPFISSIKFNPLCPFHFCVSPPADTSPFHLCLSGPGRASLHGKSSLRIENVRSDDQGWYECKVLMLEQQYDTFHNGSWVHLTVNGKEHQAACIIQAAQYKH